MEFQAPTVQDKKNPKSRISALGAVLLVVSLFVALMDGYERYAIWTFGAAVLLFILGAVLTKGDLTGFGVSNVYLTVSSSGIRIGDSFYPLGQVKNIDFNIKGYAGMAGEGLAFPAGGELDGMENYLQFEFIGEKFTCTFYLEGPKQVQELGLLFREFYEGRIPFTERRGRTTTFLFETLSKKEMEAAKSSYGFV